ncbi:MAG: hypothetical protein CMK59_01985 [Proteobacteria bacterium]|nr:hypothetical protein [Pseudomonadota bacterium]
MLWIVALGLVLLCTLYFVYTGGRSGNDHLVAVFVALCMAPYLWLGYGAPSFLLRAVLSLGPIGIWGLFFILHRRKDAGAWMPLAHLSQVSYLFSLWSWGGLLVWIPVALLAQKNIFWPAEWCFLPLLLSAWSLIWTHLHHNQVSRHRLGNNGVKLAHLSDIHVSPVMRDSDLKECIEHTMKEDPDLLLLTGDLLMPFSEGPEEHRYLIEQLRDLNIPIYACLGNHDLPVKDAFVKELEDANVHVLVDAQELIEINGVQILVSGLDFRWSSAEQHVHEVCSQWLEQADFRILLVHDPRYFKYLPEKFDLVLAGHTHGGQVAANMFGLSVSILRPIIPDQGWFKRNGMRLYVHKGNWHTGLPPRVGVASEIAIFDV